MGLVGSALTAGRNALLAYQGALQVVGNNVANSGNPDHTRQTVDLTALPGGQVGAGLRPGAGVALTAIRRNVDEALENRLRTATGEVELNAATRSALSQIEVFFDDLTGAGISQKLVGFFNALSDVQNAPQDLAIRQVAVATGDALASSLSSARKSLGEVGSRLNDQIKERVADANDLAGRVAELNRQIVRAEAGGTSQSGPLRDQRDALLRQLSQLLDIQTREQPDGSVIVYAQSEPLIQFGFSRGLTTEDIADGAFVRTSVLFADSNTTLSDPGGAIGGLIRARDTQALDRIAAVDQLAAGIINEVNAVHADGQGLTPLRAVTATSAVADSTAPLSSSDAALRITPTNGSFFITVTDDATGSSVSQRIEVDLDGVAPDTSLDDVISQINTNLTGVTATLTPDNRLSLVADTGFSFTFGHDGDQFREDTSGLLAALGINTFFEGSTAGNIRVRQDLVADPGLLAAAAINRTGDGTNAGRIGGLINLSSDALGGASILEFYNGVANGVAADGAAAQNNLEAVQAVQSALEQKRQSISGVSLDEEAIQLLKFQRAFQGAARYVSVVDQLMQEMLTLVR